MNRQNLIDHVRTKLDFWPLLEKVNNFFLLSIVTYTRPELGVKKDKFT